MKRQEQHPQSGRSEPGAHEQHDEPERRGEEQDHRPALECRPGNQLAKVEPRDASVRIAIEGLEQTGRSGNGIGRRLGVLDHRAEPLTEVGEMGLHRGRGARSIERTPKPEDQDRAASTAIAARPSARTAIGSTHIQSASTRPHPERASASRTRASPSQN